VARQRSERLAVQLKIVHRRFQQFGGISKHPPAQFSARRSDRATSSHRAAAGEHARALKLTNSGINFMNYDAIVRNT
jgi:hypothetical protein